MSETLGENSSGKAPSSKLWIVLLVVLLAGGLFGYDQGVISGALSGVQKDLKLSSFLVEVVTSWVTLGALVGSLIGGALADRIGRRGALLWAAILFALGAAIEGLAPNVTILVVGRFVVGFGVGAAAVAAPLYGSELAPTELRGRYVSAYQLAITVGIFLAYLVNGMLAEYDAWRWMLGLSGAVGVLLFLAVLPAVESPRWLMKMKRRDEARSALLSLRPGVDPEVRLNSYAESLQAETSEATWAEVFHARWRRPLLLALGLAVFQQITGINAIIYYANTIFKAAGFATAAAQSHATTWGIGAVNVVATLIAVAYIDRYGRRPLLLFGLVGMGISLVSVGIAFRFIASAPQGAGPSAAGIVTLISLVLFIISFAFSLGPVVWTVINEIFPQKVRGRAVAIATAVNWGSAFVVSQFFLSLINAVGESIAFWIFAFFCALGWMWVFAKVPETKGRTLEEIEQLWAPRA
jgi:MFS transporter, SP family, galactose:H+ symporter